MLTSGGSRLLRGSSSPMYCTWMSLEPSVITIRATRPWRMSAATSAKFSSLALPPSFMNVTHSATTAMIRTIQTNPLRSHLFSAIQCPPTAPCASIGPCACATVTRAKQGSLIITDRTRRLGSRVIGTLFAQHGIGLDHGDEREVPVAAGNVQPVADDELVGDLEAHPVGPRGHAARLVLAQQGHESQRGRVAPLQDI